MGVGVLVGVCWCGCGCVLVCVFCVCWCVCGCGWVLVCVWVCVGPPGISEIPVFVGGSRSLTIPLTNGEAVLQVGVCGVWVSVLVWVCWCVCFVCVGPPGISEIPVFVGGSRSLTIPLTNGEAVLQVCVDVCWCVLVSVCWCVCVLCVGPPCISEIPVFVGGSRYLTIPLTNGEAVLQVCVDVCWCVCVGVCVLCVGPPGISEIPVFVGGSRSLTIPLTNGEAVLQVCVGVGVGGCGCVLVWVCVGVGVFCVLAHLASRRFPSS